MGKKLGSWANTLPLGSDNGKVKISQFVRNPEFFFVSIKNPEEVLVANLGIWLSVNPDAFIKDVISNEFQNMGNIQKDINLAVWIRRIGKGSFFC